MIGQIRGNILEKNPPLLLVDVQGLGYEVFAPMSTFYQLPEVNEEVLLLTHFIVREDAHLLYGFHTEEERSLFKTLLRVNGIGPRSALTILSSTSTQEFVQLVLNNDMLALVKLPGIGKKTAERLIVEMRDKLSSWTVGSEHTPTVSSTRQHILQDAISALIALGYKQQEAHRVISKVDNGIASREELIRSALREVA